MSEYDNGDIKLDMLQKELDKIVQKREIKEQLGERVQKELSFTEAGYTSLVIAIIIVSVIFITIIIMIW